LPLKPPKNKDEFRRLIAVMAQLRSKKGCPWDRKQTHKSLKPYLLEEAYEVIEAIDSGDPERLKKELGDFLLQAVFHAQVAAEKGNFDIDDVAKAITDKLIVRHPHVWGTKKVRTAEAQSRAWEEIKMKEKEHAHRKSIVDGVPKALPSLQRARRVLSKAAKARFVWNHRKQAWAKWEEELREFREAMRGKSKRHKEEELGDVLVAFVNVARFEGLDAEHAAHQAVKKLVRRIGGVEDRARQSGREINQLKLEEMLKYWKDVKKKEKKRTI